MVYNNTKTVMYELLKVIIMLLIALSIVLCSYYILVIAVFSDVYIRNLSYVLVFLLFALLIYILRLTSKMSKFSADLIKDKKTVHLLYRGELLYVTQERKFLRSRYKIFLKDYRGYEREFYSEVNVNADLNNSIEILYGPRSFYVFKVVNESKNK